MGDVLMGVAVIMFLYSGFLYMTSSGDSKKVRMAHQSLLWAVVGLAVGLIAFSVPGIVRNFLMGSV